MLSLSSLLLSDKITEILCNKCILVSFIQGSKLFTIVYSDYSLDEQMPLLIFTDNPCIDYFIKLLHRTSMTNVSYSITRRGIINYNCTDIPFINYICIKCKRFTISFLSQTYLYCFFYLYRCPLHH